MSILSTSYSLVDASKVRPEHARPLDLPRQVANELVLLAALSHVIVTDISAPWCEELFATDSSEERGAIVAAPVPKELTRLLWGAHQGHSEAARLLSRERAALKRFDNMFEEVPAPLAAAAVSPKRPPALRFHFLGVGEGAAGVAKEVSRLGFSVGPLLDPGLSEEYDLSSPRLLGWIFFLIERGLVDAVFLAPPSGAFHRHRLLPAAPATPESPLRFRPNDPRSQPARRVLFRSLAVLRVCSACGIPCAVQVPRNSCAASLPQWKAASRLPSVSESSSGPFLSLELQSSPAFRLLSCGLALRNQARDAPGVSREGYLGAVFAASIALRGSSLGKLPPQH